MIPGNSLTLHPLSVWQRELARAVKSPSELFELLDLPSDLLTHVEQAQQLFSLRVPHSFIRRMRKKDPRDPLLLQVLPSANEFETAFGFSKDPVGDLDAMKSNGVIHKYEGRVLLVATGACAIHCRYCFRRHFPYNDALAGADNWRSAIDYLCSNTDVHEVILSGGDPLSLSDKKIESLLIQLNEINHIRTLRIHTRLPIVLPERIDESFLALMRVSRLQKVMVVHCNHPNEIDAEVRRAVQQLTQSGVRLYNQAVLLRNINDDAPTLTKLSFDLFDAGIQPYYLHCLDRVDGASHFEVDESRAMQIIDELHRRLPGYCVPRLVREQKGFGYKIPVLYDSIFRSI